uniref:AMP-binding protein n=1 Tax=Halalkalicoccus subterraneus TaxID=2675002 RepID=UPI0013CE5A54
MDSPGEGEIVHTPTEEFAANTNIAAFMDRYDIADYEALIERTCTDIEWFWDELIDYLGIEFYEAYDAVRDDSGTHHAPERASGEAASRGGPQFTDWYPGGRLNVAHNTVDRHAEPDNETRNEVACIWEGEPGEVRQVTYHDLYRQANQVANALEARGVGTGDTVGLYMPMVPEVISILYGCFKVGAIAVPIFSGFGTDATATRIADSEPSVLFTGDGFYRRGSEVRLKASADAAIEQAGHVEHTIVYERLGADYDRTERDETWAEAIETESDEYETKSLPSDQESMLLYSSGTTGKPKGIVQTHAGVGVQCPKEVHFGMDLKPADRFFWVSDIGWMMGPWTLIGTHTFGGTVV